MYFRYVFINPSNVLSIRIVQTDLSMLDDATTMDTSISRFLDDFMSESRTSEQSGTRTIDALTVSVHYIILLIIYIAIVKLIKRALESNFFDAGFVCIISSYWSPS